MVLGLTLNSSAASCFVNRGVAIWLLMVLRSDTSSLTVGPRWPIHVLLFLHNSTHDRGGLDNSFFTLCPVFFKIVGQVQNRLSRPCCDKSSSKRRFRFSV